MAESLQKPIYQKTGRPRASRSSKSRTIPKKLREVTYRRSGGHCDACGVWMPPDRWECHHRQLRSRGGKDYIENFVALCGGCHHEAVHAHPKWATERGLMVPSWADPAEIPVRRYDGNLYIPRWTWELVKENQ